LRAILGYVKTDPHDHTVYKAQLADLAGIAKAAGYEPVETIVQFLHKETVNYVFGKGKVEEIKKRIEELNAQAFIVYNTMTSAQKLNLEKALKVKVIDRYELTLEVFDLNASDKLSKMQIELAKLIKSYPYEKLKAAIRYIRDRPGPKGLGEYAYHSVIGQIRRRIKQLEEELEKARQVRLAQLQKRKELGIPIIALAGYYGAGKTSIFNALTRLNRPVLGRPFTTLSSKYHAVNKESPFLIVDTIGFAMGLDPEVIHAFRLTLDDIRFSDAVILVIDISDEEHVMRLRTKTCMDILKELGVNKNRVVVAANKVDLVKQGLEEKINSLKHMVAGCEVVLTSALERKNIWDLAKAAVEKALEVKLAKFF